jgi:CRP-like cAMP-binding protein
MATIRPVSEPAPPGRTDATLLGNRLLCSVPAADLEILLPHLERVVLPLRRVLFEPGDEVTHAHFPADGTVVSLCCVMEDGRVAEAGMIGCEGAVGALVSIGRKPASARAVIQAGGLALRVESGRLEAAKLASPRLRDVLDRSADALLAQLLQSVACNALHGADARACRWLLTLQDRAGGDELPVTQEHMAELLGVQRTTVTRVIADLAALGAVEPRRGRIVIVSRAKLEAAACECHATVRRHFACVAPDLYPANPRRRAAGSA